MFQNIKVDIIYYKTQTDFEMEFNLSGCCRMRLLTDKAPDRKILVNQLVRAVSRSRIILLTGKLFEKNGTIATAAKAIGRELVSVDNKRFGIRSQENIEIISDSIPLVSTDGIFAGCIVEQGPQTLILLTENKNIRKNVMQNLIHSYIKEVCAIEMTDKESNVETPADKIESALSSQAEVLNDSEIVKEEELILGEIEPSLEIDDDNQQLQNELTVGEIEEAEENTTPEQEVIGDIKNQMPDDEIYFNDDLVLDDAPNTYDSYNDLQQEIVMEADDIYFENEMKIVSKAINDEVKNADELVFEEETQETIDPAHSTDQLDDFAIEDDDSETFPFLKMGINIPILILSIILLIVLLILLYCVFFIPSKEGVDTSKYLKEAFDTLFV